MNRIYADGPSNRNGGTQPQQQPQPQIRSDQGQREQCRERVARAAADASIGSCLAWSDVIRSGPPTQQCLANGR